MNSAAHASTSQLAVSPWREALLFAMVALSFPVVAALEPGSPTVAIERAEAIARLQTSLGFDLAPQLASALSSGIGQRAVNVFYYGAHVPAIVATFAWLAARYRQDYLQIRRIFVIAHVLTITCYLALPTAPPRLVASLGGADVDAGDAGWHTLQYEYAAFPSGHVVFAAIVGVALVRCGGPLGRVVGTSYPVGVIIVTLATDNHFLADAIGALLVVGVAVEAARLWALVGTRGRLSLKVWARPEAIAGSSKMRRGAGR